MKKKFFCIGIAALMLITSISGCSQSSDEVSTTVSQADSDCPYDEFIVVDVFDSMANFQGLQSGWFAEIVKQKFNMELNIIAPNVTGGGDTLYEMRSAAGNLGDLIICTSENGRLQDLVSSGLLLDMSSYLKGKDIMQYDSAIKSLNSTLTEKGTYAIPSEISTSSASTPSEVLDLNYGPYLRWDLYAALGYPDISTLEDLLPVLQEMQAACPLSDSGKKTYAFSLFKDWDSNLMNNAKQPCCLYGYDEFGFLLAKADGSDYQSIIDSNSQYMRVLHLFYEANQMGLVDPESTTQNYDTLFEKYQDGQVLYSFWPWLGQSAYNTLEHESLGKGFMLAPIDDMKIYSYGCTLEGNSKSVIAIGSQAKDPKRLAAFIDWLYSPEGISINCAQGYSGTAGPEGITWEMSDEGPVLTDLGVAALMNGGADMPEELGGGTFKDGVSTLNYLPIAHSEKSPDGYPYFFTLWDSVSKIKASPLATDWQTHMKATTTMEYLANNDMMIVAPGSSFTAPDENTEITTMRSQCRKTIVEYSWKMIFAKSQDEYDSLQKEMQTTVKALGYDQVLSIDLTNAKALDAARKEAALMYP